VAMSDPLLSPPGAADQQAGDQQAARVRSAHLREIDPRTVYLLAKLRQDVFTLEQHADDADLDGRELEGGTLLMWLEEASTRAGGVVQPIAHLRVLREADGTVRIGRVLVRRDRRRGGYGRRLMMAALARIGEAAPGADVHIDAQAYLESWYAGMGFETTGPLFLEAGIEHVPMRRTAARS
jgi:ElaA protein